LEDDLDAHRFRYGTLLATGLVLLIGCEDAPAGPGVGGVLLGPSATKLTVPSEFMEPDSNYKAEILAIAINGNKTITEIEFSTN
jgi:hypothetical protein